MTTDLDALARMQVQNLEPAKRVIMLHPSYAQQRTLLNIFLNGENVVYVRFEGKKATYVQLKGLLERELDAQHGQKSVAGVRTLVLDECDRAEASAMNTLLLELLGTINNGRIVLVGRDVPSCIIKTEAIRSQTAFIPTHDDVMLWDYTQKRLDGPLVEVRALGAGQVIVDGRRIENWDGLLPRALFFYLIDRGMATRNDIFATFWPKLTTREATNVFHVTKRKINEVLGIDLTIYYSGYYRISPDINLSYDAIMFSELFQNGEVSEGQVAENLLERSLALYGGPFLATINMEWAQRRRFELAQTQSEALFALASLKEDRGELDLALNLYTRSLEYNMQPNEVLAKIQGLCATLQVPNLAEGILAEAYPMVARFQETVTALTA